MNQRKMILAAFLLVLLSLPLGVATPPAPVTANDRALAAQVANTSGTTCSTSSASAATYFQGGGGFDYIIKATEDRSTGDQLQLIKSQVNGSPGTTSDVFIMAPNGVWTESFAGAYTGAGGDHDWAALVNQTNLTGNTFSIAVKIHVQPGWRFYRMIDIGGAMYTNNAMSSTTGLLYNDTCGGAANAWFFDPNATLPPSAPTLGAAMAARAINVTWGSVTGATVYNVWRDTATHSLACVLAQTCTMNQTGFNYYGNTTNTWWGTTGDQAINNNTQYFYVVDASNGAESPPSNIVNWTYNVPNATTTPGVSSATLSWVAANGADHYNIYRALSASVDFTPMNATAYAYVGTSNASPFTDTSLTPNTTYHYRVQALNVSNAEGWASPDVTGVPTPTGDARVSLSGTAFRANATLSFSTTLTSPLGFRIYKGPNASALTLLTTVSASPYVDPQTPGQCFTYAVIAFNATTVTGLSTPVPLCYAPIPPPVSGDQGQIWGAHTDNNGTIQGGRQALANATGFTYYGIGFFYAIVLLVFFSAGVAGIFQKLGWGAKMGGIVGGCLSLLVSITLDLIPLWGLVWVAVVAAGGWALVLYLRGRN